MPERTDVIEPVRLRVGGDELNEWESIEIRRSIFSASGSFAFTLRDRARGLLLAPGQSVEIFWGSNERMVFGYIDQLEHRLDAEDHLVAIAGRDNTADLVDCSFDPKGPQEFVGLHLPQLAIQLGSPFKVGVRVDAEEGEAFDRFALEPGETAWSAIERAAKLRGLLAFSPGDGTLLLTTPGTRKSRQPLREGVNVKAARLVWRTGDQFSSYSVLQQHRPTVNDLFGAGNAAVVGSAADLGVQRFRPLTILGEDAMTDAQAEKRAQWEASIRAARAVRLEVEVVGWDKYRSGSTPGELWRVNELAPVDLPTLRIQDDMLIDEIGYSRSLSSNEGTTAKLTLVRRNAYLPEPVLPKDEGGLLSKMLNDLGEAEDEGAFE